MLHEPDELRTDVEKLLASLRPAGSLSRDETLFAAGRARGLAEGSGRRPAVWPWQVTTGVLAVALVALLVARSDTPMAHSPNMLARKQTIERRTPLPRAAQPRSGEGPGDPASVPPLDERSKGRILERQTRSLASLELTTRPLDGNLRSWLLDGTDLPASNSGQENRSEEVDPVWAPAGISSDNDPLLRSRSWFTRLGTWLEGESP